MPKFIENFDLVIRSSEIRSSDHIPFHLVNVISVAQSQSDHIKRLPL